MSKVMQSARKNVIVSAENGLVRETRISWLACAAKLLSFGFSIDSWCYHIRPISQDH